MSKTVLRTHQGVNLRARVQLDAKTVLIPVGHLLAKLLCSVTHRVAKRTRLPDRLGQRLHQLRSWRLIRAADAQIDH